MTPIENLPSPWRENAIQSPRGDHTGSVNRPLSNVMRQVVSRAALGAVHLRAVFAHDVELRAEATI
jgi:hypothetical protein